MTFEEFKSAFEILFSEPKTINSGTSKVAFNQREVYLRNIVSNDNLLTGIYVTNSKGYEEFGESLAFDWYNKHIEDNSEAEWLF